MRTTRWACGPAGFQAWRRRWHADGDERLDNAHSMRSAPVALLIACLGRGARDSGDRLQGRGTQASDRRGDPGRASGGRGPRVAALRVVHVVLPNTLEHARRRSARCRCCTAPRVRVPRPAACSSAALTTLIEAGPRPGITRCFGKLAGRPSGLRVVWGCPLSGPWSCRAHAE